MTPGVKENDDVDHASSYSPPPSSADDGFYYDATVSIFISYLILMCFILYCFESIYFYISVPI